MSRWLRVIRGMIGTGLAFAVGVGVVATIVGTVAWLAGATTGHELMGMAGKFSVVAFVLGVGFSGVLAATARGRGFSSLSLRFVSGVGAGAGLLYFGFLAMNGGRNWSVPDAIANLVILPVMGAAAAAATLIIARRARPSLASSEEPQSLGAGEVEIPRERSRSKVDVPRR